MEISISSCGGGGEQILGQSVTDVPPVWRKRSSGELGSVAAVPHTDRYTPHEDHSNSNQQHNGQADRYSHNVFSVKKRFTTAGLHTWSNRVGERCILCVHTMYHSLQIARQLQLKFWTD